MNATETLRLYIWNDEPHYNACMGFAEQAQQHTKESEVWTPEESKRYWLADQLEESFNTIRGDVTGYSLDLLTNALAEVDYQSLADDILQAWGENH